MMARVSDRPERLAEFLAAAAGDPFVYGATDCALMPADWCLSESGIDPAASIRGKYASESEWQGLANAEGGLLSLWSRLGCESGLERIDEPAFGDIGLVTLPGHGIFGAIKGRGNRWTVKLDRGITGGDFEMIAAWRVPCRHQ